MTTITIRDADMTHTAEFEPVRKVRGYTIGWATVVGDDYRFRFPAIVHAGSGFVATVSDWQATFEADLDLADPTQVADLIRTGQGEFMVPHSRAPSIVASHFAA